MGHGINGFRYRYGAVHIVAGHQLISVHTT
jgi:hypothetical protein